jgi:survival-of-motor-neuron-related-splicing factor 30
MEQSNGSSSSPDQQLREYESQLADVVELLRATPDDAALLSLKSDLEELIAITRPLPYPPADDGVYDRAKIPVPSGQSASSPAVATSHDDGIEVGQSAVAPMRQHEVSEPPKKKAKKTASKEFEIPKHLVVLDTDTEPEAMRKRRAVKALKSKWRERRKEEETDKKQKSWQSFQKKNKTTSSMFSTVEGDNDTKVGVASSGRQLTQPGERKRHNNPS